MNNNINDNNIPNTNEILNQPINTTIQNNNFNYNQNINNTYNAEVPKKNIVFFVLSIINMITLFPYVTIFTLVWMLFGALGSGNNYYSLLFGCLIYLIGSIIFLIRSIRDVAKYKKEQIKHDLKTNSDLKKVFKISIVVVYYT